MFWGGRHRGLDHQEMDWVDFHSDWIDKVYGSSDLNLAHFRGVKMRSECTTTPNTTDNHTVSNGPDPDIEGTYSTAVQPQRDVHIHATSVAHRRRQRRRLHSTGHNLKGARTWRLCFLGPSRSRLRFFSLARLCVYTRASWRGNVRACVECLTCLCTETNLKPGSYCLMLLNGTRDGFLLVGEG